MTTNPEEQIVAQPGVRASEPEAAPANTTLPAAPTFGVPGWLSAAGSRVADWASRSSIRPASACGISVAITLCSAAWLTAGTRSDSLRGVAVLWAGYLAALAARALASSGRRAVPPDRLTSVSWLFAECAVYAGLVIGATADGWRGMWTIGFALLALLAARGLTGDENSASQRAGRNGAGSNGAGLAHTAGRFALAMPAAGRVLLVSVVTPVLGPRDALLALLAWTFLAVFLGVASRSWAAEPVAEAGGDTGAVGRPAVLRLRDDGELASRIGGLVRGNLVPLPPAVLVLGAVCAFALLGPRNLPGLLLVGPALVMLLAAPGSSSRHAGSFDWLVPAVLLAAQVIYIAAIGKAGGVPGPVSYVLCAALLLRYVDLAYPGQPARAAEGPIRLGWEGRSLLIGAAAAAGLTTFAYIVLSAYLGVLVGASILASYRGLREDGASDRLGPGGWR
jgi:hypothetical protein